MNDHEYPESPAPETRDAGSQALNEALRSSFTIVKIVMVLMVLAFFSSGFFTVGPQEKAVILRLGKIVGAGPNSLLGAGLHWSFPYPIDEVVKIPISQIQKVTSNNGWYFMTPEQELSGEEIPSSGSLNPAVDSYVLTADRNIVHTSATLRYHIEDPIRAVFNFTSDTNFSYNLNGVSNAVQNVLDNALLYTAAQFSVDDILISGVGRYHDAVQARVTDLIDQENLGIVVDNLEVTSVAPRQLADIFAQVAEARNNRDKALLNAHSYENQVTNAAGAQASTITNEAESARNRYVESLNGEAKRFAALLPKYQSNPNLFAQQQVAELMGQVLTNVGDYWFEPTAADGTKIENRLLLSRPLPEPKTAAQNP